MKAMIHHKIMQLVPIACALVLVLVHALVNWHNLLAHAVVVLLLAYPLYSVGRELVIIRRLINSNHPLFRAPE